MKHFYTYKTSRYFKNVRIYSHKFRKYEFTITAADGVSSFMPMQNMHKQLIALVQNCKEWCTGNKEGRKCFI